MRRHGGQKKFEEKNKAELLPLVPKAVLLPLWALALALPNLVYSGERFADSIHIMKWVVAGAPVAVAALVAGLRLLWYGGERMRLRLDSFAVLWGLMILYCAAQPLWVDVSSTRGMVHELICLTAVWVFYVLSVDSFSNGGLSPLLWLANVNGAVNVLFAELQIRGLRNLTFLKGTPWEFLRPLSALISPQTKYFGNTFQKNMMGLWMAICVLGAAYLFVAEAMREDGKKRPLWAALLNLLLMAVNAWGLWNSFSRGGLLALLAGLFAMGLAVSARFRRVYLKRLGLFLLLLAALFGGLMVVSPGRGAFMRFYLEKMVKQAGDIAGRVGIWATSAVMLREHPAGVGIGQYKWHYLEAQREGLKTIHARWYYWRNTAWAHNEFLQWFCEAGVIGGVMLLLMFGLWAYGAVSGVRRAGGRGITPSAVWGCAVVALFAFDALWTRPFHRIEDFLWFALALAVTNREFLREGWGLSIRRALRPVGAACACASLAGLFYLGSGVEGNRLLRQARSTEDGKLVLALLKEAEKHPIVWEEAQRNLGQYDLQLGDYLGDTEVTVEGYRRLLGSFYREPHMVDMATLLECAQRFQFEDDIRDLVSYLKPGTYHLEWVPATASDGREVEALFVVKGPAPKKETGSR